MNQITHHSFSSVDTFNSCPRHWFHKYVLKEAGPQGDAAKFGSQFDQMVGARLGLIGMSDIEGAPIEGMEAAVTTYMNAPGIRPLLDRADAYQTKIELTPEQWDSYACLHGVSSTLGHPYIGFLDLEGRDEGGLKRWTLDLKTSDRKGFRSSWAIQGILYAMARGASEHHVHLLTRTKVPAVYRYRLFCTRELFAWAMGVVGFTVRQIEWTLANVESPTDLCARGGYWCSWCPAAVGCVGAQIEMTKESES